VDFLGAVERVTGKPGPGDSVEVRDASGQPLAQAAFSPKSQIRARVWSFDANESIGADFFRSRLTRALALREGLPAARHTNAMRLVHGESDGMPAWWSIAMRTCWRCSSSPPGSSGGASPSWTPSSS